jgi:DNA repair exonuclease SbcCD ATPase subunit
MSDTPRTDAAVGRPIAGVSGISPVSIKTIGQAFGDCERLARQLERELNDALQAASVEAHRGDDLEKELAAATSRVAELEEEIRRLETCNVKRAGYISELEVTLKQIRAMPFPVEPPELVPHDRRIWNQWQHVMRLCIEALAGGKHGK